MNRGFIKFPSTPYLSSFNPESDRVRNDKCLSQKERNLFLSHKIIIEEKIDGANLGISFDKDGNPIFQNRGGTIKLFSGQWKKLFSWYLSHENFLFEALLDRFVLFGEWCYACHSIYYNRLPDYFIAFDIYDKQAGFFMSVEKRNLFLKGSGIFCVPFIGRGLYSIEQLKNTIHISQYGQEIAEGLYLRIDEGEWLKQRAKFVRTSFHQSIDNHWSRTTLIRNRLKNNP